MAFYKPGCNLCLMPPSRDTTTDVRVAIAIPPSCPLTPVMNVLHHGADGVVLVMLL